MKAILVTTDKMSQEVLRTSLVKQGFAESDIIVPELSKASGLDGHLDSALFFLDMDLVEARSLLEQWEKSAHVIAFGMVDSKKKLTGGYPEHRFILKPFSSDRIQSIIKQILMSSVSLTDKPLPPVNDNVTSADVLKEWERLKSEIKAERGRVTGLLHATPDQLKTMLLASAAMQSQASDGASSSLMVPSDLLPIRSVLIVEKDDTVAQSLIRFLTSKCVLGADICKDGRSAWSKLQEGSYDLVVLSWEATEMSGLAFYNRMRVLSKLKNVPILVTSNHVSQGDFRLLDDDRLAALVERPIQEKIFLTKIDEIVTAALMSSKFLTRVVDVVSKIMSKGLIKSFRNVFEKDELLMHALKLVGDRAIKEQKFVSAESAYALAWSLGDHRLSLVTGYAKACMYQGRSEEARKLLLTADVLAPKSVERLCLLGELELTHQKPKEAKVKFDSALNIDSGSVKAMAGQNLSEAIFQEDPNGEKALPADQFPSYLNLVGISLSQSNQTDKALSYYRSALMFIREKDKQASVWFNLGMCHMRAGDQAQAQVAFNSAINLSEGKHVKADRYVQEYAAKHPGQGKAHFPLEPDRNSKDLPDFDDDDLFEKL